MRSDSSRSSTRFKEPKFHTTLQSVSVCTGADSRLEIKNYWQLLQISGQAICSDRKCCRFLVDLECFETVIDFCWCGNVHKWRKSMFFVLELLLFTFTYQFSICLHFFSEPVHGRVTAGLAPPLNTLNSSYYYLLLLLLFLTYVSAFFASFPFERSSSGASWLTFCYVFTRTFL